jgi:hypothetical protein
LEVGYPSEGLSMTAMVGSSLSRESHWGHRKLGRRNHFRFARPAPAATKLPSNPTARPAESIHTREQLIRALRDAVELETALMLQYLYAGLSLPTYVAGAEYVRTGMWTECQWRLVCGDGRTSHSHGWRGTLLTVAREKMNHLLLANNLLTAVGGSFHAPVLRFAHMTRHYPIDVELALEPFGAASMRRFVQFESPSFFNDDWAPAGAVLANDPADVGPAVDYCAVSDLYGQIRYGFQQHPEFIVIEKDRTDGERPRFVNEHPAYQRQVDDPESALFVIQVIIEQSEGLLPQFPTSHFQRLRAIERQLAEQAIRGYDCAGAQPLWNPAYPAVKNPTLHRGGRGTLVTGLDARKTMQLFNGCYEMMLQLMVQHFNGPIAARPNSKLWDMSREVMTGLLEPLGVLLMTTGSGRRCRTAGPSFEVSEPVHYIPQPRVAGRSMGLKFQVLLKIANELPNVGDAVCGVLRSMVAFCDGLATS